jgi:hypothetical protein
LRKAPFRYAKPPPGRARSVTLLGRQAIVDEKVNIDQIAATLGMKEMTQGTLIRKLCTFTTSNPTRRAIFEFDKLIHVRPTIVDEHDAISGFTCEMGFFCIRQSNPT